MRQVVFCVMMVPQLVAGHGVLCTPRQRGGYRAADKCGSTLSNPPDPEIDYCPHCLNGGSVSTVAQNLPPGGWEAYNPMETSFAAMKTRAGMCGDPKGSTEHMLGGRFMPYSTVPIMKTYKAGSDIDLEVEIDTNHNGFFEFFLCNVDTCLNNDIGPSCFSERKCHRLTRVPHAACENPSVDTHNECGPIDPLYPGRWYVPCRQGPLHMVGGAKGTMRYLLPSGVTCHHCVLQWYWATANSCAAPGFVSYFERKNNPFGTSCPGDGGATGGRRPGISTCGGSTLPEEFWSCSDVQISIDGHPEGENATLPRTSPPSLLSTTLPTMPATTTATQSSSSTKPPSLATTTTPTRTQSPTDESCLPEYATCDGSRPCCDSSSVCVFLKSTCKFSCMKWWDLHAEGGGGYTC